MAVGQTLKLPAHLSADRTFVARPRVVVATPPLEIRRVSRLRLPRLLDTEHRFILTATGLERTRLLQVEELTGMLVPLARSTIADVEDRLVELNHALKGRAEEMFP